MYGYDSKKFKERDVFSLAFYLAALGQMYHSGSDEQQLLVSVDLCYKLV